MRWILYLISGSHIRAGSNLKASFMHSRIFLVPENAMQAAKGGKQQLALLAATPMNQNNDPQSKVSVKVL